VVAFAAALFAGSALAAGWQEKVLYSFQGYPDGDTPAGGVIFGKDGNLYGATQGGGNGAAPGAVFQLSKQGSAWKETLIYSFQGKANNDGDIATSGLISDKDGNLYGTAGYGGAGHCIFFGSDAGCGLVYKLSPPAKKGGAWTETVIYSFQGNKDGDFPQGDLVFDHAGNLYGATQFGGGFGSCDPFYPYCGTIFELSPPKQKGGKWTEKVLYSFRNKNDGADPNGSLVLDRKGAIYGTTYCGGDAPCQNLQSGDGVVFRLKPPVMQGGGWTYNVLYTFRGSDGAGPNGGLIFDFKGTLYGTTSGGGSQQGGVVFALAPPMNKSATWTETPLHEFDDGPGGVLPGGLILDSTGKLLGVARGGKLPGGVVFRMTQQTGNNWTYAVLYNFAGPPDGRWPGAALISDSKRGLYGTTLSGGSGTVCQGGCGTVFKVWPRQ